MRKVIIGALLPAVLFGTPSFAQDMDQNDESSSEEAADHGTDSYTSVTMDAEKRQIVAGLNQFGADFYGQLAKETTGDVLFSPASISTAFALAHAGAKGETAAEIASTLHYPTVQDFHASNGQLLSSTQLNASNRTIAINNALWLQDELPVRSDYLELVDRNYAASIRRIDFATAPTEARNTINNWVESKTNNKIKDLLGSASVTSKTRNILVNTIYFKAGWSAPFDKSATKDEPFTRLSGEKVSLPMMHQRGKFAYAEHKGSQILSLSYSAGETDMLILLPKRGKLGTLEAQISAEGFQPWLNAIRESEFDGQTIVTIPKWKSEHRYDTVTDILKTLGMNRPFAKEADFSKMKPVDLASQDNNDWNLTINNVVHQVFIEVEEKGTEAAAATAINIIVVGEMRYTKPPKVKIFKADRPFLYLIRDRRTNAILFIGRFTGEADSE